jgi:hypothetical protein
VNSIWILREEVLKRPRTSYKSDEAWPIPDWNTVPTYLFCSPEYATFSDSDLATINGSAGRGFAPRFINPGYGTLNYLSLGGPVNENSAEKRALVAAQLKASAPQTRS